MECENPFTDCKPAIRLYREEISTRRQQRPDSPLTYPIEFVFTCKSFIHKYVLNTQHSPNPRFEETLKLRDINSFVDMRLDEFLSQEPAREIIEQRLKNWPVNNDWRTSFIDDVMLKAQDRIINMPCRHNSVYLKFQVATIHKHVFDERAAEESSRINENHAEESIRIDQNHAEESSRIMSESSRINQNHAEESSRIMSESSRINQNHAEESSRIHQSHAEESSRIMSDYSTSDESDDSMSDEDWMEEDDDSFMIPTLESSIESLETKTVIDDTTCSICLEKLSREGVSIRCSHIFHGDCIKTWLRNSHYCPVCRFEMPTAS